MSRPQDLDTRAADVHDATAALTRAARDGDPEAVARSVAARGLALDHLTRWFDGRDDEQARALHAELTAELEAGLVEARDALARMRDSAKVALDAIRGTRAVSGYGGETRRSRALDRAG